MYDYFTQRTPITRDYHATRMPHAVFKNHCHPKVKEKEKLFFSFLFQNGRQSRRL
jgi:hypothetical protein